MKKNQYLTVLFMILIVSVPAFSQSLSEINWVTEEYAPYNYSENGQPKGIFVDWLAAIWKEAGISPGISSIKILPWARGYKMAQDDKGTCLFSMTITDDRKKLFTFAGPKSTVKISVIAKKSKKMKINSVADLKNIKIGTVIDDVGEQLLIDAGVAVSGLDRTSSAKQLVQKLDKGRDDAIAYSFDTARFNMKLEGINSSDYEVVYVLKEGYMSFAFQKETNPATIKAFQAASDKLEKNGTLKQLEEKNLR